MAGQYRFLRTRGGVTSFARVTVASQSSSTWSVTWDNLIYNDSSHPYAGYYDAAFQSGVEVAAREHERRGGKPNRVTIVELLANPVDTQVDAVKCATMLATWKALGHSESDASVVFEEGEWQVAFPHQQE